MEIIYRYRKFFSYNQNLLNGIHFCYREDGSLEREAEYKNGILVREVNYNGFN